jgi:hypothetical protein
MELNKKHKLECKNYISKREVTRQRLSNHVSLATNKHVTTKELLNTSYSKLLRIKGKYAISHFQKFFLLKCWKEIPSPFRPISLMSYLQFTAVTTGNENYMTVRLLWNPRSVSFVTMDISVFIGEPVSVEKTFSGNFLGAWNMWVTERTLISQQQ